MRIVIDARYVNDRFPGIGRYVFNLVRALAELAPPHTLIALYNSDLPNTRHDLATLSQLSVQLVTARQRPFSLAEQAQIPRLVRDLRADLYHAPYYVRPYFGLGCPSIVTLYDAIPRLFPHEVSARARWLFNLLTRLAIRSSRHILAISASARADLAAAYKIPLDRITVTPLAADPRFHPQPAEAIAAVRAKYDLPERYVLSLASNKPHKNLVGLVEAFAALGVGSWELGVGGETSIPQPLSSNPCLVLAGHWDPRYPEARDAVERLGLREHVRLLPNLAEADLPALYSGAEVFAFASRYEGFGLPPLEALACGAPVLCCDTSSLPEVVGDAAVRVAPTPIALAAGLSKLLGDPSLRARLRAAGPARAAQFSWQKTAQATLAVYEQIASSTRKRTK